MTGQLELLSLILQFSFLLGSGRDTNVCPENNFNTIKLIILCQQFQITYDKSMETLEAKMKEIGDSVKHVDQLIEDFELFEEKGKVSGLAREFFRLGMS